MIRMKVATDSGDSVDIAHKMLMLMVVRGKVKRWRLESVCV